METDLDAKTASFKLSSSVITHRTPSGLTEIRNTQASCREAEALDHAEFTGPRPLARDPGCPAAQALRLLGEKTVLKPEDLAHLLQLAGDPGISPEPSRPGEGILRVPCADRESPETRALKRLVSGEAGYKSGPEIDYALLGALPAAIQLEDIVSAVRRLGIDAVCVISAPGGDFVRTSWQLFYKS